MVAVDFLLFVPEHEPVETNANEIHEHGQGVEHVMPRLNVEGGFRSLEGVLTEVGRII